MAKLSKAFPWQALMVAACTVTFVGSAAAQGGGNTYGTLPGQSGQMQPGPAPGPMDNSTDDNGQGRRQRHGPPIDLIAHDLGKSPDDVRTAFREVGRPATGRQQPTEEQFASYTQKLASALNVPVDKLRSVLEKYRPKPPDRP